MKANFNLNYILSTVCSYYGLEKENVKSNSRKANYIEARQLFFYIARNHSESSLIKIGEMVNRDHSTVVHLINKVYIQKEIYSKLKNDIKEIEILLYSTMIPNDVDLLKMTINYTNYGLA